MFTDQKYISYHGTLPREKVMMEEQYQQEYCLRMGGK